MDKKASASFMVLRKYGSKALWFYGSMIVWLCFAALDAFFLSQLADRFIENIAVRSLLPMPTRVDFESVEQGQGVRREIDRCLYLLCLRLGRLRLLSGFPRCRQLTHWDRRRGF